MFITFLATPLINEFIENTSHVLKLYYSSDDHEMASENKKFYYLKKKIINSANIIIVTSQKLFEKFNSKNKNIFKFHLE